ncbi:MAG: tetratricopeptide repeat protein [bacterium]
MENLGLNNDVLVGERKFHVQTSFSDTKKVIVSNVFNEGQVIDSREVSANNGMSEAEVQNRMQEVHQELVTEMEILYYINEKVKAVRHAPSANKLGLLFLQKNLHDEAINQFELALEIDPDYPEVYCNLGKSYLAQGNFERALAVLEQGAQHAPEFADLQNFLGIAYLHNGNHRQAVTHMEKALKLNPNYIGVHYHLGMAYLAAGQTGQSSPDNIFRDKATRHLKVAADKMINRHIPNFDKVMGLLSGGSEKEALDEFFQCTPNQVLSEFMSIENEFYLKFMYGGKGKDDTFIADYVSKLTDLLDEFPNYADLRNNLGVAYLIQCRNLFLKSLDEFRGALKINPNFKKAEKNLKLAENDGKGFLILLRAILK